MIRLIDTTKRYRSRGRTRIVLNGVDAHFERGHSYGILGLNGAGKSTLMRLLAGVEQPDGGRIRRDCRVSWPVGFSGCFHPKMTGKENVIFVSRLYGQDPVKATRFVQEFAELGTYFVQPVSTYSSGMRARLAFGMSLSIPFECYLIDEVTAVGDARFRERCALEFDARREHADVIFVSHSFAALKRYCDRGGILHEGKLFLYDTLEAAYSDYQAMFS